MTEVIITRCRIPQFENQCKKTSTAAALDADISYQTYEDLKSGKRDANGKTLWKIAHKAFGANIEDVFVYEEVTVPPHKQIARAALTGLKGLMIIAILASWLLVYHEYNQPRKPDTFVKVQVNGTEHVAKWNGNSYVIDLPKTYYANEFFTLQK